MFKKVEKRIGLKEVERWISSKYGYWESSADKYDM